jgi:hypothetical protein
MFRWAGGRAGGRLSDPPRGVGMGRGLGAGRGGVGWGETEGWEMSDLCDVSLLSPWLDSGVCRVDGPHMARESGILNGRCRVRRSR